MRYSRPAGEIWGVLRFLNSCPIQAAIRLKVTPLIGRRIETLFLMYFKYHIPASEASALGKLCRRPIGDPKPITQERNKMDDSIYWAHLAAVEGMGVATFEALIKRFGSIQRAMAASVDQLKEIPSLDERTAEAIRHAHLTLNATREKIEELESKGMRVLTSLDNAYPARLRQAANPPPVIFQAGKWEAQDNLAVAIIGSRKCSGRFSQTRPRICAALGRSGFNHRLRLCGRRGHQRPSGGAGSRGANHHHSRLRRRPF